MNNKRKIGMLTSSVFIIAVLTGWFFISQKYTSGESLSILQYLSQYIESDGHVVDVDGSISVDDIEDIKYKVSNDKITIYFGKIVIPLKREELKDEKIIKAMNKCGLKIEDNTLYYFGETVPY